MAGAGDAGSGAGGIGGLMAYGKSAASRVPLSALRNQALRAAKANTALRQRAQARIEYGSRF